MTELPGSFNLRDQKFYEQNENRHLFFRKKKKRECFGQKHKLNLNFKLEVEPDTLIEPPGSFNLQDQNFFSVKWEVEKKGIQNYMEIKLTNFGYKCELTLASPRKATMVKLANSGYKYAR